MTPWQRKKIGHFSNNKKQEQTKKIILFSWLSKTQSQWYFWIVHNRFAKKVTLSLNSLTKVDDFSIPFTKGLQLFRVLSINAQEYSRHLTHMTSDQQYHRAVGTAELNGMALRVREFESTFPDVWNWVNQTL